MKRSVGRVFHDETCFTMKRCCTVKHSIGRVLRGATLHGATNRELPGRSVLGRGTFWGNLGVQEMGLLDGVSQPCHLLHCLGLLVLGKVPPPDVSPKIGR